MGSSRRVDPQSDRELSLVPLNQSAVFAPTPTPTYPFPKVVLQRRDGKSSHHLTRIKKVFIRGCELL